MDIKDCKPGTKVVIISKTAIRQNYSYGEWFSQSKSVIGNIESYENCQGKKIVFVDTDGGKFNFSPDDLLPYSVNAEYLAEYKASLI